MTTIPIQLNDADVKKIDFLVKSGRYKSRNQAIKKYLEEGIAKESIDFEMEDLAFEEKKAKIIELLDKCPAPFLRLKSGESFTDQVMNDRDR